MISPACAACAEQAARPPLCRAGERSGQAARALARRLATFYVGTGVILAVALFAVRGLAERLFGDSYGELSTVITMLLGLPVLRATINLPSDGQATQGTWYVPTPRSGTSARP